MCIDLMVYFSHTSGRNDSQVVLQPHNSHIKIVTAISSVFPLLIQMTNSGSTMPTDKLKGHQKLGGSPDRTRVTAV